MFARNPFAKKKTEKRDDGMIFLFLLSSAFFPPNFCRVSFYPEASFCLFAPLFAFCFFMRLRNSTFTGAWKEGFVRVWRVILPKAGPQSPGEDGQFALQVFHQRWVLQSRKGLGSDERERDGWL